MSNLSMSFAIFASAELASLRERVHTQLHEPPPPPHSPLTRTHATVPSPMPLRRDTSICRKITAGTHTTCPVIAQRVHNARNRGSFNVRLARRVGRCEAQAGQHLSHPRALATAAAATAPDGTMSPITLSPMSCTRAIMTHRPTSMLRDSQREQCSCSVGMSHNDTLNNNEWTHESPDAFPASRHPRAARCMWLATVCKHDVHTHDSTPHWVHHHRGSVSGRISNNRKTHFWVAHSMVHPSCSFEVFEQTTVLEKRNRLCSICGRLGHDWSHVSVARCCQQLPAVRLHSVRALTWGTIHTQKSVWHAALLQFCCFLKFDRVTVDAIMRTLDGASRI